MPLEHNMALAIQQNARLIEEDGGQPADIPARRAQLNRLAHFWAEGAPAIRACGRTDNTGGAGSARASLSSDR